MVRERILEIGVGKGGVHLNPCSESILVGLDQKTNRLRYSRRKYPNLLVCESDLVGPTTPTIPFVPNSFTSVELRFPHNDLLFWLVKEPPNLWDEFKRVLKPNGTVLVVFDVPPNGRPINTISSRETVLFSKPENLIWENALKANFEIESRSLTKQEAYDLTTVYGKTAAHWMKENSQHRVYLLKAKLPS